MSCTTTRTRCSCRPQGPSAREIAGLWLLFKVWVTVAAVFFWPWPALLVLLVWRPVRYPLVWLAMAGIRRQVVRRVRPNAGQLPEPGRVSDPDAAWRQWLDPQATSA